MTPLTLILRSLRFHWRSHLGVVLGAAIGSAAIIGALIVGDSVRGSLRERVLVRLGKTQTVLSSGDRLFRADLAKRLTPGHFVYEGELRAFGAEAANQGFLAPVLQLPGTASTPDGTARANRVQVLGVDSQFWKLATKSPSFGELPKDAIILNRPLAEQLSVKVGDDVLLRIAKPSLLSQDAPIAPKGNGTVALRGRVHAIASDAELGLFGLRSERTAPLNAFVSLQQLQEYAKETNRANLLLVPPAWCLARLPAFIVRDVLQSFLLHHVSFSLGQRIDLHGVRSVPAPQALASLQSILRSQWALDDAELQLLVLAEQNAVELRSRRVFLDAIVTDRVLGRPIHPNARSSGARRLGFIKEQRPFVDPNAQPILTYLVNLLRAGTNATPYSMVTAAGAPWTPPGMSDDEILVNQWLADDLRVKAGDEIQISYYLPESGAALREATNSFRVRAVVPMQLPWADRSLMPDFPGIEKAESTADWDTAFPLVHKIRPQDEAYWKQFRGTPKAFVTLAAGQKMWGNRFGNLTAIRFSVPTNGVITIADHRAALEPKILSSLRPEELGLQFEPVREQALESAAQAQDFGGLFIGFSFFLIAAALLLMALLFQFGVEQRTAEIGTLLALGFTPKQVRRLWLVEGAALAFAGAVLGTAVGVAYARAVLLGLTTIWSDAVGGSTLHFFVTPQSLVIGLAAATLVAVFTIWLTLRQLARRPARELLAGETEGEKRNPKSKPAFGEDGGLRMEVGKASALAKSSRSSILHLASPLALAVALALVSVALARGDTANAGVFFGAGVLVLGAGLGFVNAWLARLSGAPSSILHSPSSFSLALSGLARRRSRSLATVALLAGGSFLIASIGVFRLDADRDATRRSSGTGGFALIGEATLPIIQDLNTKAGRDSFGLEDRDLAGVNFVQFRVRDGDEANCLNLNRSRQPRLLGVRPEALVGRFTFTKGAGWHDLVGQASRPSLNSSSPEKLHTGATPVLPSELSAIGDAASIQWALDKRVGDTLDYVDEQGRPFKVRIVGAVANSVLQGSLVVNEAELVKRFPGAASYRFFLMDTPTNSAVQASVALSRSLQDYGLEVTPAPRRLAQFNAVQNTYLGTFQVLGGLGLLLGSAGLGVVVLRNVLERRGELGLLLAVGWRRRAVQRLVLTEHAVLLALGLGIGVVAAAVAVLPALLSPGTQLPWATLLPTLTGVLVVGALATLLATCWALRGNLLSALRNE